MDTAVRVFNGIGTLGGLCGLGWVAYGIWEVFIGIRREMDEKKDKGLMGIVCGAALGVALKAVFSAVASGLSGFNF